MPKSVTVAPVERLADLLEDWQIHLRARNVSRSTIASYLGVANSFVRFLDSHELPATAEAIKREHLELYLSDLADQMVGRGRQPAKMSPATVAKHFRSLQQLFVWLVDDGELERSPMERMRPPAVPEQPVAILTVDDLMSLLSTCRGNTFENRRDLAILRLFIDTGMRAGELAGLQPRRHRHGTQRRPGDGQRAPQPDLPVWRQDRRGAQAISACATDPHPWLTFPNSGSVAKGPSPIPECGRCSSDGPTTPASRTSILTGSGTPSPTSGWPKAAKRTT